MEVNKWPIFSLLKPDFIEKMKMIHVFGKLAGEAIIITKDDDVYALGSNHVGCLGVGDQISTMGPRKIESLCQKKVKGIACGSEPHVLVYTENGELYSWGSNEYQQLGNSSAMLELSPNLVNIPNKRITQIAAGGLHSLALTVEGEVFAWGYNAYGQVGNGLTLENVSNPSRIFANGIVDIACGQMFSMAVMSTGEVYGWGLNTHGQLGTGNRVNQLIPCKVTGLQGIIIIKIACGHSHTLALSNEGNLYAWGSNICGQLGTGYITDQCSPVRAAQNIGRIVNIASIYNCSLSAAMTENAKVYLWGYCKGQNVVNPLETELSNLHEVFALWSTPSVTYESLNLLSLTRSSIAQDIALSLDDKETVDVTFVVGDKKIGAHRSMLKIRSIYYRTMFNNCWKEVINNEIEVKYYSYNVFRAFLQYIYTDTVNILFEDIFDLLDLAEAYCEDVLKNRCVRIIRQGITKENAVMVYAIAIRYNTKELEDFCFRFALNYMTEITLTEAFMALDELTIKTFIQRAAQHGAFKC
nr:MAG: RCBTB1-like protein [Metapenaeopsis lamellata majanivirus]